MSNQPRQSEGQKLGPGFYARPAKELAIDLLGTVLVRRWRGRCYRARIVETEAYVGTHDLACHASKGLTPRTAVMFGPPGRAYVYLIYGMYEMFNIVCSTEGDAQAVLIRAAEAIDFDADLSGPGKLTRGLRITRKLNGADLFADELNLQRGEPCGPHVVATRRIGVDYARQWKDAMLRFYDGRSKAVSRPRK